eukprot:snap_masked-scaffold_38-processed-gene-0.32-mRNA-1 protein AED:1.00 eAED:1.00 QI:0/0/0/0/1/1/2/0/237
MPPEMYKMSTAEERREERKKIQQNALLANAKVTQSTKRFAERNGEDLVLDRSILGDEISWCLVIKNCENSRFVFSSEVGKRPKKIFIENCTECIFEIDVKLITQHLEVSRCLGSRIVISRNLATLQADLCDDLKVVYKEEAFENAPNLNIFLSGSKNLGIQVMEKEYELDYRHLNDQFLLEQEKDNEQIIKEELQFHTKVNLEQIITTRVYRHEGALFLILLVCNSENHCKSIFRII